MKGHTGVPENDLTQAGWDAIGAFKSAGNWVYEKGKAAVDWIVEQVSALWKKFEKALVEALEAVKAVWSTAPIYTTVPYMVVVVGV